MKTYTIGTQVVIVRAESEETKGICSLLEMHHPPDTGPPLHYHTREDEGFYILEGSYRFRIGDERRDVGPGDFVIAPRGVRHCFQNLGPETGRMLVSFIPGGGEKYFELMAEIAMDDSERGRKCKELDDQFGIVMIGGGV